MKKMLLSASALVFGGVVLAQTSNQAAAIDAAKTNPWAGSQANYGVSEQYGNNNKVRVRQAGQNQEVYTFQADGKGKGGNLASVTQISMPGDKPNYATSVQVGTKNEATTLQVGKLNTSGIYQGLKDPASSKNKAFVDQNGTKKGNSTISQDGKSNIAASKQRGKKQSSSIAQEGNKNEAYVYQLEGAHKARVSQVGNSNFSTVHQEGAGVNKAATYQTGGKNLAFQYQKSVLDGAANGAVIVQGGDAPDDDGVTNKFGAYKNALKNYTPSSANTVNNQAGQFQTGNGNGALAVQFGTKNSAQQIQKGDDNAAVIGQDGVHNYANQLQKGNGNAAGILQLGKHNKVYQRQYGNDNFAVSLQEGSRNLVNTYQEGNQLVALTAQSGSKNQALVVQKGNAGQVYGVVQSGNGNIADIMQLDGASCGDFPANEVKCEFPDIKVLKCPIDIPDIDIKAPCPGC